MSRKFRNAAIAASLTMAVSVSVATSAIADNQSHPTSVDVGDNANLGPKGEVPVEGVTDEDVRQLAEAMNLPVEDMRFAMFEGSEIVLDFIERNRSNPSFGSLSVSYDDGLSHVLRLTTRDDDLESQLETSLGRPYELVVGGLQAAEMERRHAEVSRLLAGTVSLVTNDEATGVVKVVTRSSDTARTVSHLATTTVDPSLEPPRSLFWAGAGMQSCTAGFVIKHDVYSINRRVVTAGHCNDTGMSIAGVGIGNAAFENCHPTDSQAHYVPTSQTVWYGFYGPSGWTNIYAQAGGYYPGQIYFRRGERTIGWGAIDDWISWTMSGTGDCAAGTIVSGLSMTPSIGSIGVPGDSGGPIVLSYGGQWYLGAILSAGGSTQSFGAWRRDFPYYTMCTQLDPCS